MSVFDEAKQQVLELLYQAEIIIPEKELPTLPRKDTLLGEPEWYDFEHQLWKLGEQIRQIIVKYPTLRKDKELQDRIIRIATDRRAKRGRQSFINVLESKLYIEHAHRLISQLDDESVGGQIIAALLKMQAGQFVEEIRPFTKHNKTWIRNYAKRYIERYSY